MSTQSAGDSLSGGHGKLICVSCGLRKDQDCYRRQKDGKPFQRCIRCEEEAKAARTAQAASTAIQNVAKHFSMAMTRKREEQPHLGDAVSLIFRRLQYLRDKDSDATPLEVYCNLVGDEVNRVFSKDAEDDQPDKFVTAVRQKYIAMLNTSLGTLLRNDEGFKPEEMDREEVRDSLKALGVEEVRNDPELLKLLLREQGLEVVDVQEAE